MKEIIVTIISIVVVVALAIAVFLGPNSVNKKIENAAGTAGDAVDNITTQLEAIDGD